MATRVLIVDDHPAFRASARRLLEAAGFDVVGEAEDAAGAVRAAGELVPDLALVDVQLPDRDGFAVAAELRGRTPVILTSSRDGSDFGSLVAACGALGFIPKHELSGPAVEVLL